MDLGPKIYTLALTHAIGHPYFDKFIIGETQKGDLSLKGQIKKYLFKLLFVIQSDTSVRFIIGAITLNCIYERIINS